MSPSRHIREHVVGYVAVFLALSGTAAASLPGTNTVDSGDIVASGVTTPDLASNAVIGAKIFDESLTSNELLDVGVGSPDLRASAVSSGKTADGSLGSVDFDFSVQDRVTGSCAVAIRQIFDDSVNCTAPTTRISLLAPFPGTASVGVPHWAIILDCRSSTGDVVLHSFSAAASANWLVSDGTGTTVGGTTLGSGGSAAIHFGNGARTGQVILSNPLSTTTVQFDARYVSSANHCRMRGTAASS